MATPAASDDRRLRAASRLAVAVARAGESADPPEPAPAPLRPVLGFSRLAAGSYALIQRVVDEDGIFRARVAEEADEHDVGRAGWLWLHRPVGWQDDPAFASDVEPPPARAKRTGADDRAAKHRRAAEAAEAARREALDRLDAALAAQRSAESAAEARAAEIDGLREERHQAVRRAQALETELAALRRDLKLARAATREAEAELLAVRQAGSEAGSTGGGPDAATAPASDEVPGRVGSEPVTEASAATFDGREVARSVLQASDAARALAEALASTAERLAAASIDGATPTQPTTLPPEPQGPSRPKPAPGARRERGRAHRRARRPPNLPPGVFGATDEAHRHLIADGANQLLVDGYNLARDAWSGLAPEEERRRTMALLEDVQARSGGQVVVVFDGDDGVVAPRASRHVLVRYSATGQTADDVIVELVAATSLDQPVVVVSSDRAVAAGAERHGATVIGSRAFLSACGR